MITLGLLEWFHFGRYDHVELFLKDCKELSVQEVRTGISWAEWWSVPGGREWITWLINRLASEVRVLPCFLYTPPDLGRKASTNAPPRDLDAYAAFIDEMMTLFGDHFEYIELWNEPNNTSEWDSSLDPGGRLFAAMISRAAVVAHAHGKKVVLGGMAPIDLYWLGYQLDHGTLDHIDVLGVHAFPGTWESTWSGWDETIAAVREKLLCWRPQIELWITETGFSTLGNREEQQVAFFQESLRAPVARLYWYAHTDLPPQLLSLRHSVLGEYEPHEYHMGMKRSDGSPKLLFKALQVQSADTEMQLLQSASSSHLRRFS